MQRNQAMPLLFMLALGYAGCTQPQSLLVHVERIPLEAQSLQVFVTHTGLGGGTEQPSQQELLPYDLPQPPPSGISFRLDLLDRINGNVTVNVGALDKPGAGGCLRRIGVKTYALADDPLHQETVVALDKEVQDTQCTGLPRLLSVTPAIAKTTDSTPVTVYGWGFKPAAEVSFASTKAAATRYVSAHELSATPPTPPPSCVTELRVTNPNAAPVSRADLFHLANSTLDFGVPIEPPTFKYDIKGVTVLPLDQNSSEDVILTYRDNNDVSVTLFPGPSNFGDTGYYQIGPSMDQVANAVLSDIDQDGDLDLISASFTSNEAVIYRNDGTGRFANSTRHMVGQRPRAIAAADLNGDGYPDLITVNETSRTMIVLLNNKSGGFGPAVTTTLGKIPMPYLLAVADFTGDGLPDAVIVDRALAQFSLLNNMGNGVFPTTDQNAYMQALSGKVVDLQISDLNGDGKPELLAVIESTSEVYIVFGPRLQDLQTNIVRPSVAPRAIFTRDMDCDGRPDLIVASQTARQVQVLLQQADGRTYMPASRQWAIPVSTGVLSVVAAGNIRGTGKRDLMIGGDGGIAILPNSSQ